MKNALDLFVLTVCHSRAPSCYFTSYAHTAFCQTILFFAAHKCITTLSANNYNHLNLQIKY